MQHLDKSINSLVGESILDAPPMTQILILKLLPGSPLCLKTHASQLVFLQNLQEKSFDKPIYVWIHL